MFCCKDESLEWTDDSLSSIGCLSADEPHYVSWVKDLGLSMLDKEELVKGRWLSANHISAGQRLLRQTYPHQHGLQDTCKLSQKKWLDVPQEFVQVIYVAPDHWACLTNKFTTNTSSVELYDSMHTLPGEQSSIVKQACAILKAPESSVTINVVNVQRQREASDCGLFALAMATDLCQQVDPVNLYYHQDQMRAHLKECFEQSNITPFPSTLNSKKNNERVVSSTEVEIYCLCRQPEVLPMIECDNCKTWYHADCASVSEHVLETLDEDTSLKWFCTTCEHLLDILHKLYCTLYCDLAERSLNVYVVLHLDNFSPSF